MVFQNDKQRKGFFARIAEIKATHEQRREQHFNERIARERQELNQLQRKLEERKLQDQVRLAKQRQVQAQKDQIQHLKDEEKATKKAIFEASRTGRAVNLLKKEAKVVGGGVKKVATSKQTKKVLGVIAKQTAALVADTPKRKSKTRVDSKGRKFVTGTVKGETFEARSFSKADIKAIRARKKRRKRDDFGFLE